MLTPYSVIQAPKKKRGAGGVEGYEEEGESEEEGSDDVTADAMVKVSISSVFMGLRHMVQICISIS